MTRPAQDFFQRALAHHRRGELTQAQSLYRQALDIEPRYFDALHLSGVAADQIGESARARELLSRAIAIDPDAYAPHANLGNALRNQGEYAAALASFDRALILSPMDAIVHSNRGNVLADLRQFRSALASYDRALQLDPGYAAAHNNRGNSLRALDRLDEAVDSFGRAIALDPRDANAHANLGHTLQQLGRHAEAIVSYDTAIALAPASAPAYRQRGVSLDRLGKHAAALLSHGTAIRLAPADPDSYTARGNAYRALQDCAQALNDYAAAIALDPRCKEAHFNRGAVLDDLKEFEGAAASYAAVLALQVDYPYAAGLRLHAQRQMCDWQDAPERANALSRLLEAGAKAVMPFHALVLLDAPGVQRVVAERWSNERSCATALWRGERYRHQRLRIGYLSADFHDHPVSHLIAGVLERHDRTRFETFGISLQPHPPADPVHLRMRQAFEHFHEVSGSSDRDAAQLLRELEIDIAVDLTGYTGGGRLGILAFRPAPLQVSFLGYAGTTGARFMDFLIADAVTIPRDHERFFSERIVRMPHSCLPNDDRQSLPTGVPMRRGLGLPDSGFVFCAFNDAGKFSPRMFEIWLLLLNATPGSVLWMRAAPGVVRANLARAAESRGVAAERLVFAPRMPAMRDHLARYPAADLFLDTLPYGAHSTARDALWSGVPVLTCMGDTFAGRVAGSLLSALQLPELVTWSLEEYTERALEFAHSPAQLAAVRVKLAHARTGTSAFDTDLYRRHLESAYVEMQERQRRGEPAQSFNVTALR